MAEEEVRRAFETVLGETLPAELGDEVVVRERVAVTLEDRVDGSVTSREIGTTGQATKACRPLGALDVGGTSRTGQNGKTTFRLSDFHCLREVNFQAPVNFVATPQASRPLVLTSVQKLAGPGGINANDVEITVFAWDMGGNPLSNVVVFDWRCIVPFAIPFA